MKKSYFLLGLLFLIFILPFSAASVEKFNDWVYDSDTLVLDSNTFKFKISNSQNSMVATLNDKSTIINLNNCKDFDTARICLDDISIDAFKQEKSAKVRISYFEPNITVVRTVDKGEVFVGDYIEFDVKVTNSGDIEAKNLVYTDYFPLEIFISEVKGDCKKDDGNKITYAANLKPSESFSCSYTILLSKETEQKLKAQIDYELRGANKKIFSNITSVKSKPLYSINAYQEKNQGDSINETKSYTLINKAKIEVGEEYDLLINLSNTVLEDLVFKNFTISFPKEMMIKQSSIEQNKNICSWSGMLQKNSSKLFYFTLVSTEGGNFEINYESTILKNKNLLGGIGSKSTFEILSGELQIFSNLDNITNFDGGKEMYITFSGKNTNNFTEITSGFANISSDILPPTRVPISRLKAKDSTIIFQATLLPKNVSSSISKKITLDAEYITEYGVKKAAKKEWSLTIKSIKDIEIAKTLSKSTITEGDDIGIYVTVKNTRSRPIYNLKIEEVVPEELGRSGKTKATVDTLMPDETVSVYNYTIKAPKVKKESKFLIKTLLSYFEEMNQAEIKTQTSLNVTSDFNLTVSPKKIDLSIQKSADYSTINLGESVKVTYTIENKDSETAYDLNFFFSKGKYTDLLNEYTYKIDRLEPGEVMTFKRETIKPKKDGSYYSGETIMVFKDVDDNIFNYTFDSLLINVQNRSIKWPSIILTKTFSKSRITEGDELNITFSAENLGDEGTELTIDDNTKEIRLYAAAKNTVNYTYSLTPGFGYKNTDAYAYYKYQGNEYRVYAKSPDLIIVQKPETKEAAKISTPKTSATKPLNITAVKVPAESTGSKILNTAWTKIKSWFGF